MFDKTLHPDCDTEGPFGVPMKDAVAKQVEALLKAHPQHDDAIVKLASISDVSTIEGERADISKITTETVDRDREVVRAKGINLEPYKKNAVVLLNHRWDTLPLGKALWIKEDPSPGLVAKTQYAKRPREHQGEWIPDSVYSLVKEGMLPGKSIGFVPLESRAPTKMEIEARPDLKSAKRIITESVLLEYSVVAIPANPEALVETVMKSYPGLAAMLPDLMPLLEVEQKTAPAMTLEDLAARFDAFAKTVVTTEQLDQFAAKLATLTEDGEAFKIAIRSLRKDLLAEPKAKPQAVDVLSLMKSLDRQFQKICAAS